MYLNFPSKKKSSSSAASAGCTEGAAAWRSRRLPGVEPVDNVLVALAPRVGPRVFTSAVAAVWIRAVLDELHDRVELAEARRIPDGLHAAPERLLGIRVAWRARDSRARQARETAHEVGATTHGKAVQGAHYHVREAHERNSDEGSPLITARAAVRIATPVEDIPSLHGR